MPIALFFGVINVLASIRNVLMYFFLLGVAVACLVVSTTPAHYIGAVLLAACLLVAFVTVRRRFGKRKARLSH